MALVIQANVFEPLLGLRTYETSYIKSVSKLRWYHVKSTTSLSIYSVRTWFYYLKL